MVAQSAVNLYTVYAELMDNGIILGSISLALCSFICVDIIYTSSFNDQHDYFKKTIKLMSFRSLQAVTSRILNDLEGEYDDTRINNKLLRDKVLVARASVIMKNYAQYPGTLPGQLYNKCCFEVACEPICPGAPVTVVRGKIPSVLSSLGRHAIRYLGSVDGVSFEWKASASKQRKSYVFIGDKKEKPYFVLTGDHVEVYNRPTDNMSKFIIYGVFSDPTACECKDDEIFVPEDMIDQIEQQVKYDLASFLLQRRMDKMNNTNADI